MVNPKVKLELLFTENEILQKVEDVAEEIDLFFKNEPIVVIGVMKGALFFMADLLRSLKTETIYDFIQVKTYAGTSSTGNVTVVKEPNCDCKGKNVLIVEDILDTGVTISFLKEYFEKKGAKKVYICSLLNKQKKRIVNINADFTGFDIEDYFVVGYGLDFDEKFRALNDIFVVKQC